MSANRREPNNIILKRKNPMKSIEIMADAYNQRLEYRRANPNLKSQELFYSLQKNYYQNMLAAKEDGKPIAWNSVLAPVEVLHAMDIVPYIPEGHAINMGIMGGEDFYQISEGYGIANETCSTHRVAMGLAVSGMAPDPDMIVSTAHVCDAGLKTYENFAKYYKKPSYTLDRAYGYDKDSVEFYKEEIRGLIAFLEEETGRSLDYDRLTECCKLSHESFRLWLDI
jgi:benzoyl-CoA reductase/2-hydroxyglutaryl-CoA dehydratase subunit BcrC/BadD/HgdB